jgi:hypothetical protein
MSENLDECVLDRFVSVRGVAQVLIGDAQGAALMTGDQLGEAIAGFVDRATLEQGSDVDRQPGIFRCRRRKTPRGRTWRRPAGGNAGRAPAWPPRRAPRSIDASDGAVIHKETTMGPRNRLQFTP